MPDDRPHLCKPFNGLLNLVIQHPAVGDLALTAALERLDDNMNLMDTIFFAKLHDSGVQLAEADIAAFEEEIEAQLPSDYRQFLLLGNGGRFYQPLVCPIPNSLEFGDSISLSILFRLLEPPDENTNDLRNLLEMHRGRIPAQSLAIATDGDNLLLLDLHPDRYGSLSLWIRDDEMMKDVEENRLAVAPS